MSSFFKSLATIGGSAVGRAVTSGLDYVYDALPSGVQGGLSSVGSFFSSPKFTLGSASIGKAVGDMATNLLTGSGNDPNNPAINLKDLPSGTQVGGSNFSSARGGFQAGQAQMMPFGKTDRVSRAMQDQRVANRLSKMAQGYRIPSPNLRSGSNISLASARTPAVSLARKYSKGTVKA